MRVHVAVVVFVLALASACSSKSQRDKHEFYGITFTVPAKSTLANTGNSLPGPEPEGGWKEPPFIHPGVSVNGVGVEIWKDPSPSTIEGMKQSYAQVKQFVKVDEERVRADGYDFTYSWRSEDGSVSQVIHRYFQLGNEQYTCKYYSSFSKMDEAERVCRSIRRK